MSASDLGTDANALLFSGVGPHVAAAGLVGATVTHRRRTSRTRCLVPLDGAMEVAAAQWVASELDPETGLLSAATAAALMPAVFVEPVSDECFRGDSCLARQLFLLALSPSNMRDSVLTTLLDPIRLLSLRPNVASAAAAGEDPSRRLSVEKLFGLLSDTLLGVGGSRLPPPEVASAGSLFRDEAMNPWVGMLSAVATADFEDGGNNSAAVRAAAAWELSRIAEAVAGALAAAPGSVPLRGLRILTAAFLV